MLVPSWYCYPREVLELDTCIELELLALIALIFLSIDYHAG